MKDLLKDKRVLIVGVVVLLLVVVGAFFVLNRNAVTPDQNTSVLPTQIPIPSISAESIGLSLEAGAGGRTVIATVENTQGIAAIEYELSYLSKGDIPRGALGTFDLTRKPARKEITLGTCSDTCHYDTEVSDLKLLLKITKDDGKVYQAQASLESVSE